MSEVTMQEFKDLCSEIITLAEKKEKLQTEVKELNKELMPLEAKAVDYLETLDIDTVNILGYNFSGDHKEYAKVIDKNAFMNYLKNKDQWDSLATVNAATAKKYYEGEKEKAIAEGNVDFKVDGMEVSSSTTVLKYKKAK